MMTWLSGLLLAMGMLLIQTLSAVATQVESTEPCLENYKKGKNDFFVNVNESVSEGASFLASPSVETAEDCVRHCCDNPFCNLALVENGSEEGAVKGCYLFDCLYMRKYVCMFVKMTGFSNYILKPVFDKYLHGRLVNPGNDDRPPVANAGQDKMVQPNVPVFLNGFQSRDNKMITSYRWSLVKGETSVVIEKTDLWDQVKVSNLSIGEYVFRLTVLDSRGQSDSDEMTVQVLRPRETKSRCLAPKKVGPCRASFLRWYYNATSQKCVSFMYGGCRSNLNNYLSDWECNTTCVGASANSTLSTRGNLLPEPEGGGCNVPCGPDQFPCPDSCCSNVTLLPCNVEQCSDGRDEASCHHLNETFGHLLNIHVDKLEAQCTEPPETGPCRANMRRYFYNPIHRKCFQFTYGGCRGNQNNFELERTCMDTCKSITEQDLFMDEVFERSEDRGSGKGGVAVGLLVGGAIVALLAFVGYRALKKKRERTHHHPVPVNVPAVDEMNVYNGTTKPL